jgi:hypothetical protein
MRPLDGEGGAPEGATGPVAVHGEAMNTGPWAINIKRRESGKTAQRRWMDDVHLEW